MSLAETPPPRVDEVAMQSGLTQAHSVTAPGLGRNMRSKPVPNTTLLSGLILTGKAVVSAGRLQVGGFHRVVPIWLIYPIAS